MPSLHTILDLELRDINPYKEKINCITTYTQTRDNLLYTYRGKYKMGIKFEFLLIHLSYCMFHV